MDLERHRLRLEENVAKLQELLRHWQAWDAEYEGLKEELLGFEGQPTTEDMLRIAQTFGGDLIVEREIKELLGHDKGPRRTGQQVVDVVSRRQDYVLQNITTIQKQLNTAERKLSTAMIVSAPEIRGEDGLPLTEIREELDDDGNIICNTTTQPGAAAPAIEETLRKAGVKELPEASPPFAVTNAAALLETKQQADVTTKPAANVLSPGSLAGPIFVSGTKISSNRIVELNDNDEVIGTIPIIPNDESAEDAALRQEMLAYGLNEVGAVVAELDLEEFSDDPEDDFDDEDTGDYESSVEEEDQYGRSTRSLVDEEYRKEMLELEKRLNARMVENVGPSPKVGEEGVEDLAKDVRRLVVQNDMRSIPERDHGDDNAKRKAVGKKGVRFAETLDVSPAPSRVPGLGDEAASSSSSISSTPMSEVVIERGTNTIQSVSEPAKPKKGSHFKSARHSSASLPITPATTSLISNVPQVVVSRTTRSGPPGEILSTNLIERSVPSDSVTAPDENGLDPALLQQEVATEYHRLRNRMIQRQGGFVATEEDESQGPLMEERDGKVKKVSRFKAARLGAGSL
ncbi:hypothetical protein B0A49_10971 [Cryomyces minteri]|uniref:DUF3835 domain-containing protein n=1 Tax=Cryomyces minteri TaxID=331657 RepID=A0A4U0WEC7_9PEZI|nr:hypothetical protein B0A49_10971 [Cryomyces minteri]